MTIIITKKQQQCNGKFANKFPASQMAGYVIISIILLYL